MTTPAKLDWTRCTPALLPTWRAALKVGDQVGVADLLKVNAGDADVEVTAMTVLKVTPSGQVCVEPGNGLRFTPSAYRGSGKHATLSIFPLVEEAPQPEDLPAAPAAAPNEGTITLSPSPVRVTELEGKLVVQSDYNADFVSFAKSKKARFSEGGGIKVWSFDPAHKDALAKTLTDIYGADGLSEQIRTVDVRLELDKIPHQEVKAWWFLGRELARRGGYDWSVKAPGVKVIKGDWSRTGGSRTQPRITAETGTVIEVSCVPLALALKEGEARSWEGISLVKREEETQAAPVTLRPPVKIIADAGLELPALKNPYGGSVPINITVRRQEDLQGLQGLDEAIAALRDWTAALAPYPQHRQTEGAPLICAALAVCAEELRALLTAQPYTFWAHRAQQVSHHDVNLAQQLLQWGQMALGLDGLYPAQKAELPVIELLKKVIGSLDTTPPGVTPDLPLIPAGARPPYLDVMVRRRATIKSLDTHRHTWRAAARPEWSADPAWSTAADQLELHWDSLAGVMLEVMDGADWHDLGRTAPELDRDICRWVYAALERADAATTWNIVSGERRLGAALRALWTPAEEQTPAPVEAPAIAIDEQLTPVAIAAPQSGLLPVAQLVLDERTQLRAARSEATLEGYAGRMARGESGDVVDPDGRAWPAVVVYYDEQTALCYVADGHHRVEAARLAGLDEIQADVRTGTLRDAVLHAASANIGHGLPASRADKQRAIRALLSDPEWSAWSDREIARRCGASHPTVATVRAELVAAGVVEPAPVRHTAQGRDMAIAGIQEEVASRVEASAARQTVEAPAPSPIVEEAPAIDEASEEVGGDVARHLLPAQVPFGALDTRPIAADDVRALRAYLGLSLTRFGALVGASRQRVAAWEREGTETAHQPVNALLRLYLAQLPKDPIEEEEELDAAVAALATLPRRERALDEGAQIVLTAPAAPDQATPTAPPDRVSIWDKGRGGKGGPQVGQAFLHRWRDAAGDAWWIALTVVARGKPLYHGAEDAPSLGGPMDGAWAIPLTVRSATEQEIETLGDKARHIGTRA